MAAASGQAVLADPVGEGRARDREDGEDVEVDSLLERDGPARGATVTAMPRLSRTPPPASRLQALCRAARRGLPRKLIVAAATMTLVAVVGVLLHAIGDAIGDAAPEHISATAAPTPDSSGGARASDESEADDDCVPSFVMSRPLHTCALAPRALEDWVTRFFPDRAFDLDDDDSAGADGPAGLASLRAAAAALPRLHFLESDEFARLLFALRTPSQDASAFPSGRLWPLPAVARLAASVVALNASGSTSASTPAPAPASGTRTSAATSQASLAGHGALALFATEISFRLQPSTLTPPALRRARDHFRVPNNPLLDGDIDGDSVSGGTDDDDDGGADEDPTRRRRRDRTCAAGLTNAEWRTLRAATQRTCLLWQRDVVLAELARNASFGLPRQFDAAATPTPSSASSSSSSSSFNASSVPVVRLVDILLEVDPVLVAVVQEQRTRANDAATRRRAMQATSSSSSTSSTSSSSSSSSSSRRIAESSSPTPSPSTPPSSPSSTPLSPPSPLPWASSPWSLWDLGPRSRWVLPRRLPQPRFWAPSMNTSSASSASSATFPLPYFGMLEEYTVSVGGHGASMGANESTDGRAARALWGRWCRLVETQAAGPSPSSLSPASSPPPATAPPAATATATATAVKLQRLPPPAWVRDACAEAREWVAAGHVSEATEKEGSGTGVGHTSLFAPDRVDADVWDQVTRGALEEPTTTKIVLRGASVWGLLHALETLPQLTAGVDAFREGRAVLEDENRSLDAWVARAFPGGSAGRAPPSPRPELAPLGIAEAPLYIADRPEQPWRGLLLDTARHFIPVDQLLALVDGLAGTRFNLLHWHLIDAASFPLHLPSHPELAAAGAWAADKIYRPEDVARVVRFAAERGVRVMAEVDVPAHAAAWGRSHLDLLASCPTTVRNYVQGVGVERRTPMKTIDVPALNPAKEGTYALIADILADVRGLFPDAFLHWGGDEVDTRCWEEDASLVQWSKEHGMDLTRYGGPARLLAYFYQRVWNEAILKVRPSPSPSASVTPASSIQPSASRSPIPSVTPSSSPSFVPSASPTPSSSVSPTRSSIESSPSLDPTTSSTAPSSSFTPSPSPTPSSSVPPTRSSIESSPSLDPTALSSATPSVSPSSSSSSSSGGSRRTSSSAAESGARALEGRAPYPVDGEPEVSRLVVMWQDTLDDVDPLVSRGSDGLGSHPISERVAVQPWKCWSNLEKFAAFRGAAEGRGVVQNACYYLDWDSKWEDFYNHNPMKGLDPPTPPYSWPQGAPRSVPKGLAWGGEASMWVEMIDWTNVECRVWPRTTALAERLWSSGASWSIQVPLLFFPSSSSSSTSSSASSSSTSSSAATSSLSARIARVGFSASAAAPRFASHRDLLARRGLYAAPLSAPADLPRAWESSTLYRGANGAAGGWCRNTIQEAQRPLPASLARPFTDAAGRSEPVPSATPTAPASLPSSAPLPSSPPPSLPSPPPASIGVRRVMTYNIDEGGRNALMRASSRVQNRTAEQEAFWPLFEPVPTDAAGVGALLDWVREQHVDVWVVCEAVGWAPGRRLSSVRSRFVRLLEGTTTSATLQQNAFRAGFAFAEILVAPAGYHVAILSTRPIRVLDHTGGADVDNFQRAFLAAEIGGVVVAAVHLHAHSAELRRLEAARVAARIEEWEATHGWSVLLLGDLNTLSPLDAHCHVEQHVLEFITSPNTPSRLRAKYLRAADPASEQSGAHAIDYRPMNVLLFGEGRNGAEGQGAVAESTRPVLVDLFVWSRNRTLPQRGAQDRLPCVGTQPTEISMIDSVDVSEIPPYRLDYILGSSRFLHRHPDVRCEIVRTAQTHHLSDHYPVVCEWSVGGGRSASARARRAAAAALEDDAAWAALDAEDRDEEVATLTVEAAGGDWSSL